MSLRVRVELTLFVVLSLVIGLGYGLQRFVMLPSLDPLEQAVATNDMDAIKENLAEMAAELGERCEILAADPAIKEHTTADTHLFSREDLGTDDFYFFVANTGAVFASTAYVPGGDAVAVIEEPPPDNWPAEHPLLALNKIGGEGIYLTSAGPALVAGRPVVEDTNFMLVLGRFLDEGMLLQRRGSVRSGFRMWAADDRAIAWDERAILNDITERQLDRRVETTEDMFQVYSTFPSITGEAALLLRADTNRNILSKAHSAIQNGLLVQTGIGLSALVVLIILFRRSVMNPLSDLTFHTVAIRENNNLSARLNSTRNDEIGILSREFDHMLEQLEEEVEEQRRVKEALHVSEERYALAVRGANDGLWDWDLVSGKIHFSERWKGIHGSENEAMGETFEDWLELVHPDDRENFEAAIKAHLRESSSHFESEHREYHNGGQYVWVLCRGISVCDEGSDKPTRMAGSHTDITLRKLFEEQLTHQALHDSLTSLPNRALFMDRVSQAMRRAQRGKDYTFAVLLFDLDRFKVINDSLGLGVGDMLLALIGERLSKTLRGTDTISRGGTLARFGGDEFVLLIDNLLDLAAVTHVATRVQQAISEPCKLEGHEIALTASVGIALNSPEYQEPEEMVRNADTAMHRAKALGVNRFEIFDAAMHSKAMQRLELENEMRAGLERGEFVPYFQPIVNLESGKIEGFEALARWQHPERGIVSPLDFIPIAEETGMIVAIGDTIRGQACHQVVDWRKRVPGCSELRLSANLSPKEFQKKSLCADLEKLLKTSGLPAKGLKLEVTESAFMDNIDFVTNTLKTIRELGIELAIDDFGTGYSSLSYLHRFSMDVLKIDQAFVRDMLTSKESAQIINTIVLLARALHMTVIAEGIEDADHLRELRELGCELGQGYHFAKPLPAPEMEALLEKDPTW